MIKTNHDTTAEEQWKLLKLGKFGASNNYKLMMPGKDSMFSKTGLTYIKETACDAYTKFEDRDVQTYSMMMGKIREPEAYAFLSRLLGFEGLTYYGDGNPLWQPYKAFPDDAGGSPDAVAYAPDGGVSFGAEFKCPDRDTHWDYLTEIKDMWDLRKVSEAYYCQCQKLMHVFECDLWLWCSFSEYYPVKDRMLIIEVKKDKKYSDNLSVRLPMAIKKKHELIEELKNR